MGSLGKNEGWLDFVDGLSFVEPRRVDVVDEFRCEGRDTVGNDGESRVITSQISDAVFKKPHPVRDM